MNYTDPDPDKDPHYHDLGYDPATKKFRKNEADTGLRVEKELGVKLKRYNPPEGKKGDWVDEKGVIYDGCSPAPKDHFDKQWDNYKDQLRDHLDKVDKVPIDVTDLGLTDAQKQKLRDHIKSLPAADQKKIVLIGMKL
jgi:hypothetical protein